MSIRKELYENRNNIPLTLELLKPLLYTNFTKGDMLKEIERLEGKSLPIDFAIPQSFFDSLIDMGIDPSFYVWSYEDTSLSGKPLNLLERYFRAFCKAFNHGV